MKLNSLFLILFVYFYPIFSYSEITTKELKGFDDLILKNWYTLNPVYAAALAKGWLPNALAYGESFGEDFKPVHDLIKILFYQDPDNITHLVPNSLKNQPAFYLKPKGIGTILHLLKFDQDFENLSSFPQELKDLSVVNKNIKSNILLSVIMNSSNSSDREFGFECLPFEDLKKYQNSTGLFQNCFNLSENIKNLVVNNEDIQCQSLENSKNFQKLTENIENIAEKSILEYLNKIEKELTNFRYNSCSEFKLPPEINFYQLKETLKYQKVALDRNGPLRNALINIRNLSKEIFIKFQKNCTPNEMFKLRKKELENQGVGGAALGQCSNYHGTINKLISSLLELNSSNDKKRLMDTILTSFVWLKSEGKKELIEFFDEIPQVYKNPLLDKEAFSKLTFKEEDYREWKKTTEASNSKSLLNKLKEMPLSRVAFLAEAEAYYDKEYPRIVEYGKVLVDNTSFADCVETTLRNFVNLCLASSEGFKLKLEFLEKKASKMNCKLSKKIEEFYSKYELMDDDQKRNNWAKLTANNKGLHYVGELTHELESNYKNFFDFFGKVFLVEDSKCEYPLNKSNSDKLDFITQFCSDEKRIFKWKLDPQKKIDDFNKENNGNLIFLNLKQINLV